MLIPILDKEMCSVVSIILGAFPTRQPVNGGGSRWRERERERKRARLLSVRVVCVISLQREPHERLREFKFQIWSMSQGVTLCIVLNSLGSNSATSTHHLPMMRSYVLSLRPCLQQCRCLSFPCRINLPAVSFSSRISSIYPSLSIFRII